jgi:hypothetical protein
MITDVLAKAVKDINGYLSDPKNTMYEGPIRRRIENLTKEMDSVRAELDLPPGIQAFNRVSQ